MITALAPSPSLVLAPPFTLETALQKVRRIEDAHNSRAADRMAEVFAEDCEWRSQGEFIVGRTALADEFAGKWERELNYRLAAYLWAFTDDWIAVRFQFEWHDAAGFWYRSHGSEMWTFDAHGLIERCDVTINDVPIAESDRQFFWPASGPRPGERPALFSRAEQPAFVR